MYYIYIIYIYKFFIYIYKIYKPKPRCVGINIK